MPEFTTGPATLADIGQFSYNGCIFSPLGETNVSGTVVKDNAGRTTKLMEYLITYDGYVTMSAKFTSIAPTMVSLKKLLSAQGGALQYKGRGLDLEVNTGNGISADAAWGPIPKLLEFQPLGAGRSAKIRWQVTVHLTEIDAGRLGLLQFNYETTVTYGEDGYSSMTIRGTMEVPMTRTPSQTTRTLTNTVDNKRQLIEQILFRGIDLSRFRFLRREVSVSRDKRTMEFDIELEEKPYMDLPPSCTVARGNFNVKPARAGAGLVTWHCTLKATYTVRADVGRQAAWYAFGDLLRLRMLQAERGDLTPLDGNQNPGPQPRRESVINPALFSLVPGLGILSRNLPVGPANANRRKALLIDFSIDEGVYLDSKTVSFSATWRLMCEFADILLASGLWTKLPDNVRGTNIWAASMQGANGMESWAHNRLDPSIDVVVDFGI